MADALTSVYPSASHDPYFATYGNSYNSYTHSHAPERIDVLVRNIFSPFLPHIAFIFVFRLTDGTVRILP